MVKTDYEKYIDDILKISPISRFVYGKKDKSTLSHIENSLSDDYFNDINKIITKFEDTTDIELKKELNCIKYNLENKLYLFIYSSYYNFIVNFIYNTNYIYPKNEEYKRSRQKDFDKYIQTSIMRAKEGLRLNITYPKIIIKKFLEQIKTINKYKYLYNFIKKYYYPYCRNEIGLCYIKNGKDIYKNIIKDYIGHLDLTPEEIHNIGLKLVKSKVKLATKYTSKKELMDDCHKYAAYVYDNILDIYFNYKMKKPFVIREVHKDLESSSPLAYYNEIEKAVFINTSYYHEIDKKEIYSLIMHECMHYYHFEYMEHYKVPKYKRYDYSNIAVVEGFAHYMEIYCDDYDDDNNSFSLLRKLRLIVDTGINYYGWTYKQGLDYLNKYLPNKKTDNINEIDRYICMPGQALSYVIGKLHIIELRDVFIAKGGNIKEFHHKLLMEGLASFITIDKVFK